MKNFFEESSNLDCFIILNKGLWALDYFEKFFSKKDFLFGKNFNYYTYWPPYSRNLEKKFNPQNYKEGVFGEIQENYFEKRGIALVLDDEIESGFTLSFVEKFLNFKGYSNNEIFVFGKDGQFGSVDIRPLNYYSEKNLF
jgi:hypothetical protein